MLSKLREALSPENRRRLTVENEARDTAHGRLAHWAAADQKPARGFCGWLSPMSNEERRRQADDLRRQCDDLDRCIAETRAKLKLEKLREARADYQRRRAELIENMPGWAQWLIPPSIDDESEATRPPYLVFLNRLFEDIGEVRIEGMKKPELEAEILKRWPVATFGTPSINLIAPMATILRSLRAKRGGAKRQRQSRFR